MPQDQASVAALRSAAQDLLADERYQRTATSACKELDDLPDVDTIVDLVEGLLR